MAAIRCIQYSLLDTLKGNINVERNTKSNSIIFNYPCEDFKDCTPYKISLRTGLYRFELWGAKGGDTRIINEAPLNKDSGGKGAYTSGTLFVDKKQDLYLYLGGIGGDYTDMGRYYAKGGYNGGGSGGADEFDSVPECSAGGGGATDIRLIPDMSLKAFKSRIMVAAGGGGATSTSKYPAKEREYKGGDGGTLIGGKYNNNQLPGDQTSGVFGKGQDGHSYGESHFKFGGSTGGGGGGYYGGKTNDPAPNSYESYEIGGAGGSSYISGHAGCNSVANDELDPPTHIDSEMHYSGIHFWETSMKMVNSTDFVDPHGNAENGHFGYGAAKITVIYSAPLICVTQRKKILATPVFVFSALNLLM